MTFMAPTPLSLRALTTYVNRPIGSESFKSFKECTGEILTLTLSGGKTLNSSSKISRRKRVLFSKDPP